VEDPDVAAPAAPGPELGDVTIARQRRTYSEDPTTISPNRPIHRRQNTPSSRTDNGDDASRPAGITRPKPTGSQKVRHS